ncbi:MAG: transposase [Chitinophagaceae bacterium]
MQTVVDAEHKIPIDYLVTNTNDSKAMGEMLERTNEIIPIKNKTILYDKGYHTGSEIKKAFDMDVNIMVAIPAVSSHAPDTNYDIEHFIYDKENDLYRCPQNQTLHTNGKEYTKHHSKKNSVQVIHYKTAACLTCPAFAKCTTNKKGRLIERSEYADYIAINKQNIEADKETYKQRQCIVEHPYGIIKRQWGFYYIMTKRGKQRASADVGLMFTAYNLRRLFNIIDQNVFKKFLKELVYLVFKISTSTKSFFFKMRLHFSNQLFNFHFFKLA